MKALTKIWTTVAAITIAVASSITPATAVAPFVGPTNLSTTMNLVTTIPLDDDAAILIWRDGQTSPNVLKASLLQADGNVAAVSTIFANTDNEFYSIEQENAWTRMPDGTIALTFTTFNMGTGTSTLKVAYTDNGVEWTEPLQVEVGYTIDPQAMCDFGCGYTNSQIAADGLGHLALQFNFITDYGHSVLMTKTLTNGQTWQAAREISQAASHIFASTITGQPGGGFINSWVEAGLGGSARYVSRTIGSYLTSWATPKLISSVYQVNLGSVLLQTKPNEYALVYVTIPNDTDRYAAVVRRFNSVTKVWYAEQQIMVSGAASWLNGNVVAAVNSDGTVGVVLLSATDGANLSKLHFNTFKGGVVATKPASLEIPEQNSFLSSLSANKDGSFTIVYGRLNGDVYVLNTKTGAEYATRTLPFGSGQTSEIVSTASPMGNVFVVSVRGQQGQFVGVNLAGKPNFTGTPRILGKAKKGAKLTAGVLNFNGVSGFGARSYQWYACSAAVPVNTLSIPSTCVAIAKANTPQFTVTAKQKGKFITVATKSSNSYGETVVLAPSTTKSK